MNENIPNPAYKTPEVGEEVGFQIGFGKPPMKMVFKGNRVEMVPFPEGTCDDDGQENDDD